MTNVDIVVIAKMITFGLINRDFYFMDINVVLAENLKALRANQKLSLDKVAEMTGVSKTMLGQIERGESNPTINTVWKIANGLKVSFTELIHQPRSEATVMTKQDVQPLQEDNGRYRFYPYFPIEEGRRFEMYTVEVDKGGYLSAEPHRAGTEEFTVKVGESIRFKADRHQVYHNSGDSITRVSMVLHYPH